MPSNRRPDEVHWTATGVGSIRYRVSARAAPEADKAPRAEDVKKTEIGVGCSQQRGLRRRLTMSLNFASIFDRM